MGRSTKRKHLKRKEGKNMKRETRQKIEGMKQQKNPIVLQKVLFCIVQNKTAIEGFWKNEEGKVFIDNIEAKKFFAIEEESFRINKKLLFAIGEEAVFWKDVFGNAVIENKEGKKEVLKNRIAWIENKKPSKSFVEVLLKSFDGFTVYQLEEKVFLIETYKA